MQRKADGLMKSLFKQFGCIQDKPEGTTKFEAETKYKIMFCMIHQVWTLQKLLTIYEKNNRSEAIKLLVKTSCSDHYTIRVD
jgi:hypothetical protein